MLRRLRQILLCFLLLACFVSIAPVTAQTPTGPTATTLVQEVSEATQTLGILTVVILVVLGILAVIVVIVLVVAAKGLQPLLNTIRTLNDARGDLQDQLFKRLEAGDKERAKTAEINERTVSALNERETKTEAEARSDAAVKAVNTHTDASAIETRREIATLRTEVSTVIESLKRVEKRLGGGEGDDTADLSLSAAFRMLSHIERRLDQLGTGPLDPAKVPQEPPPSSEPGVWSGDHPEGLPPETE